MTRLVSEDGLLLLSCGTNADTIRILCPLTIADGTLDEGLRALERCLKPDRD